MEENKSLIAVVIADSFDEQFEPLTQDEPKILIPLVNTPMLDYTLDWLEHCAVDEAIIYCKATSRTDKIRDHCRLFGRRRGKTGLKISVIASEDCCSLGDAMRDLYEKSLLTGDFILVQGGVVANIDLRSIVDGHKERHLKDKSSIMTCVYLVDEKKDRGKTTIITNSNTGKIVHPPLDGNASKLQIPTETILSSRCLRIYPHLQDPSICVCAEVIPSLFSDNFDYETRSCLVKGVIEQEELLGYSIYASVVDRGYASTVYSLSDYEDISIDIVRRLAYPAVPEISLTSHRIRYTHDPFTTNYWEESAKLQKTSLGWKVVVGAGSEISEKTMLHECVIGCHSTLHDNVIATRAFIMDHVIIGNGCQLNQCFIGNKVTLLENVIISPGCVIGAGVVLGPNITVLPSTRLMLNPQQDDFCDKVSQEPNPLICGTGGRAFKFETEDNGVVNQMLVWGASNVKGDDEHSDEEDEEREEESVMDTHDADEDEQRENEFKREVTESLLNGLREKSAAENIILEINSSRHAYNMSMDDVLFFLMQGILKVSKSESERKKSNSLWKIVKDSFIAFTEVLKHYIKLPKEQCVVLKAIEHFIDECTDFLSISHKVIYELNQEHELLDDDVVIGYFKKGGDGTDAFDELLKNNTKFLQWLEEEEDTEESD